MDARLRLQRRKCHRTRDNLIISLEESQLDRVWRLETTGGDHGEYVQGAQVISPGSKGLGHKMTIVQSPGQLFGLFLVGQ